MDNHQVLVNELFANCKRACRFRKARDGCTCAKVRDELLKTTQLPTADGKEHTE